VRKDKTMQELQFEWRSVIVLLCKDINDKLLRQSAFFRKVTIFYLGSYNQFLKKHSSSFSKQLFTAVFKGITGD
jgi:hypothetical protein